MFATSLVAGRSNVSWWNTGEGSGSQTYNGKPRIDLVTCGFCGEAGKFEFAQKLEKKNSTGKILHYDTLKCEQCGNYTFAFWSIGDSGLQGIHQLPYLRKTTRWPDYWPADVGRYWLQAKRNVEASNWDAAALMARSAVQLAIRHAGASGKSLFGEINDLGSKGLLPPIMVEWAHEVRELGNENAHPTPDAAGTTSKDAIAVVEYLSMLLKILFDLPHQIASRRGEPATIP
nr:DUF4145 domain-containing protein [Sinorhizobium medicae]